MIDYRYSTRTIFSSYSICVDDFREKLAGRERKVFALALMNKINNADA